ncbi:MAG: pyridoxal-dependent decarboxylase [Gammaproteobacteria bacterium]|jgi:aromatic-L-amino-acid decarboxylase|nr:pyridoxal-dependent decarboxylase [Gammaproteobacteria bacterium]
MTKDKHSFHMSPDEFRQQGYALIDWLADYAVNVEQYPVLSQVAPGAIRSKLPDAAPVTGEPFAEVIADFERDILPGITHWQSPNFFAYFPANNSGPSVLGELLSAGLGVQGMLWLTSPACTELEAHVLDWVVDMLGLPGKFKSTSDGGGVIQDSASSATLCALLTARERATRFDAKESGPNGRLIAYCSTETHSSMEKACAIAGIGLKNLRKIVTDGDLAMDTAALAAQIETDREAGLDPFFVCATIGTTSSLAIDPIAAIADICKEHGIWLHIDAAMAGTAAVCEEHRDLHRGVEHADSYCFNPHKWMFTNFDCDCFFVADRKELIETLTILPEYLRNQATESGEVIDYRDWQVPLGRRFRALKLWFVIRHYGIEGLQHHIREHIALSARFAQWVKESDEFEIAAPPRLNLVCFRHRAGDEFNRALIDALNKSGRLFLSHTTIGGEFCLRFCIGQTTTVASHVAEAWQRIEGTARELGTLR